MIARAGALQAIAKDGRSGGKFGCGNVPAGLALKFSTGTENFNGWREATEAGGSDRVDGKSNENGYSLRDKMNLDFGECFAYKDSGAQLGKSS